MATPLYPHQQRFIDTAPNKHGMFFGTGTGKTLTAIRIAEARAHSVLIICPKGIKSKWQAEKIATPHEVLTKEEFKKHHKTLQRYDAVIWDEAHHASGMKSQVHKATYWYIKNRSPRFVWLCTATPRRRDAWNIYALARLLGHDWNYQTYRQTFFFEQHFGYKVVWLPKKDKVTEKKLIALVHKLGNVVAYEDVAEMPPVAHIVEYVEKTKEQKQALKDLELQEANPLTFYLREHQIMANKGAKDERIEELVEECAKLAIFCRYTDQIDRYKALYPEAIVIDGRTKDKNAVAGQIESLARCIVLIQSDSAEGYELPSIHTAVFASMSYSFLAYQQSLGRFIRINQNNKPKRFIYLITKKTIDEDVYKNIMGKKDFDLALYSKERGKS